MDVVIKILASTEVDVNKWNALVKKYQAPIYAQYNYIHTLCKKWKVLVVNDYELILPIPYKTKLAIPYAYSVPFIQQLGFIGDIRLINDFAAITKAVKKCVKLGEIYANHLNRFLLKQEINVTEKLNLILPLDKSYNALQANFSKDALRNIAKANKQNFYYSEEVDIATCLRLYQENYGSKLEDISGKDYQNFEKLCLHLSKTNHCFCRAVYIEEEIVACAIILKDENKLYNIANTTTAKGKKLSANYFLFSNLLHEFALTNLILDFEGSSIAGIRKFYESFGGIPEPYFMWQLNFLKF